MRRESEFDAAMTLPQSVVFDYGMLFQALISAMGPAGRAVNAASEGLCLLFLAEFVLNEFRDITSR